MMRNDTNMTCQLYNFKIENQLLNFCVGKSVGRKSSEVSRHVLKVSCMNNEQFKAYDPIFDPRIQRFYLEIFRIFILSSNCRLFNLSKTLNSRSFFELWNIDYGI